ncbi:hypothetical protein [Streptosporangium roseum]|uniref:ABM domain-containing protein n=1 Tax=Streptosporangium roseum (strain ATCC 12428 / DSM 43021 / JCM 3005 / KCTC 9067 / NCIMB 10171 / NRRL 2505 / NI 9100) TaxID=479432 RepID=D2B9C1_STRRD|nr:hypothetical protein [Streptosporangium roseum]ACZ91666.1 hypothetical protein Sros_9035 [Streptosporangium roseum DSM 43021]
MSYAFTYEVPIGPDTYARIKDELGPDSPPGMILHLAHNTDQGLRYVEVWESKEAYLDFVDKRLHPVVDRVVTQALGFRPPEPPVTMLDFVDVWTGDSAA